MLADSKEIKRLKNFQLKSRMYRGDFKESDTMIQALAPALPLSTRSYLSDSGSSAGPKLRMDLGLSCRE